MERNVTACFFRSPVQTMTFDLPMVTLAVVVVAVIGRVEALFELFLD